MNGEALHVVAAAVIGGDDRVLIARRPRGSHLEGLWEFPGGKLEAGEARPAGLRRELLEELGIVVESARPLMRVRHAYPERRVLLDVWVVDRFTGVPTGLEGQALRWCARADLPAARLLPADRPIVTALRLPAILAADAGVDFELRPLERFAAAAPGRDVPGAAAPGAAARMQGAICDSGAQARFAAERGADFIVLRSFRSLAELNLVCEQVNLPVYAGGLDPAQAWEAGAAGAYRSEGAATAAPV